MAWYHKFPWTNFHELNLDWILGVVTKVDTVLPDVVDSAKKANDAASLANTNAAAASDAATRANNAAQNIDPLTASATTVYGAGASVTVEKTHPGTALHFYIPAGERGLPGPAGGISNLLDNGNFSHPVNQRGKNSYNGSGAKVYTLDRWFTDSTASPAVTINSNYITVAPGAVIKQIIPAENLAEFPSDVDVGYTAVARETNGTLHIASAEITDSKLSFTLGEGDAGVTVVLGAGSWEYCAFYKGAFDADTAPGYQPMPYVSELLTCKRFYNVVRTLIGTAAGATRRSFINLPVPMYITPTVSYTVIDGNAPESITMDSNFLLVCVAVENGSTNIRVELSAEL